MSKRVERIAIIGGVAGGAGAAAAARRANETAQIDVFEAGSYVSFANCGLPYYLSGEIEDREDLLVTTPELLHERFRIDVHLRHRVVAIDRDAHVIRVVDERTGATFDHAWDRLVIATGARSFRLPVPGLDHPRIAECRTIDDVDRIVALASAHAGGRSLVIGGGFIGLEVAEALATRGLDVTLVDLAPQVLPPLDAELAGVAAEELERHGVALQLGTTIETIEHGPEHSVAHLENGASVPFHLAVVAVGVVPEASLAKDAGLALGRTGGIVVDEHQRTSDPSIFAAGDVTELTYWPTGGKARIALAGPANKQARVAGTNAALPAPALRTSGAAGTSIVRVFGLAFGITGLSEKAAVAQGVPYRATYTRNNQHAGYFPGALPVFIKLLWSPEDGRVLGAQVFGAEGVDKRLDVIATAIQARFTVDDLADVDLAYAPPFGSAKDPVVIAGMVASNAFHGRSRVITPRDLSAELASGRAPLVLDVRTAAERKDGRIDGSVHIPIDELRERHGELPNDVPIVIHCAVGYRGYVAERILVQLGFDDVRNLTGGYSAWSLIAAAAQEVRS